MKLMLNNPITEEQWDAITDVDFERTSEITFHTKHGKEVTFVKRKTAHWKAHEDGSGTCTACHFTQKAVWDMDSWQEYCGKCGAKMEGMGISPWPEVRK